MIRRATRYDKTELADMMRAFRDESPIAQIYGDVDERYFASMLDGIFAGQGAVFFEQGKGFLMCAVLPSVWSPEILALHELAWYVRPDYRKGTTGYRLFQAYIEYGNELKKNGRIKYYTMTKLDVSPALDYSKYGFRKKDENWIQ